MLAMAILIMLTISAFAQNKVTKFVTRSENDLVPEGIATDPRNGFIYISSIAKKKIVVFENNGSQKDFISTGQDGFLEGLGMKVDTSRNLLWAISVQTLPGNYISHVHGFNLANGKTKYHYSLQDTTPLMFNDIDIDRNGDLYITDTHSGGIYFIDTKTGMVDLFLRTKQIQYPNGIALGKNNQIYLATYGTGLLRIDIPTKKVFPLIGYKDTIITHGLDGIVFSDNTLMGVYNYSIRKNSFDIPVVIKYHLDETGSIIIKETILAKGGPEFAEPTTLALSGNEILVLANTHLGIYNANQQSLKGKEKELKPVTVLRYRWRD